MKNTLKLTTLTLLALAISLNACKKEEETADTTAPEITINSPLKNGSYTSGDMVHIEVDVTDNDEIHEIEAFFTATHMGMKDTVWQEHYHPDAASFSIEEHYTIGTVMHTDFMLTVVATDHSGNVFTDNAGFHVMN